MSRKALVGEEESDDSVADDGTSQIQDVVATMDASDLAMQREAVSDHSQASTLEACAMLPRLIGARSDPTWR
mgnify:CR=1 FL=1